MALLSAQELNYARPAGADETSPRTRDIVVANDHPQAVLHVGLRPQAAWLECYPLEFALGPGERQRIVAEIHPERSRNRAMAVSAVSLFGQYIAPSGAGDDALPDPITVDVRVVPPASDCPTCGADLPEGATECRRCGERLRLCPACGAPNTWRTHLCRVDTAHIVRPERDWLSAPGGGPTHVQSAQAAAGVRLAKAWSVPTFPPTSETRALEWSAPLLAFGMVIAAAIDSAHERAIIYAFELTAGTALWEYDLGDPSGIYPDRGGLAISDGDGLLYAATLNGTVVALDSVRGTLRWTAKIPGPVYGAPAVAGAHVVIPSGKALHVFDRLTGVSVAAIGCAGRLDTAPAISGDTVVAADDTGSICAHHLPVLAEAASSLDVSGPARPTGTPAMEATKGAGAWQRDIGGSYDAAPVIAGDTVYAAGTSGALCALSLATGEIRWTTQLSARAIGATPALSPDNLLYVGADDGAIHVVAADTGNQIRTRKLSESPIRTAPIVTPAAVFAGASDGRIYAMTPDYAADCAYETTAGARITGAGLALYGDYLAAPCTNGVLYILRITQ